MLILLASPEAVAPNDAPDTDVVGVFTRAGDQRSPVFVVSHHAGLARLEDSFAGLGPTPIMKPCRGAARWAAADQGDRGETSVRAVQCACSRCEI